MEGMFDHRNNPRDWVEDFPHENGTYQNKCIDCDGLFIGHKRRCICKKCSTKQTINIKAEIVKILLLIATVAVIVKLLP